MKRWEARELGDQIGLMEDETITEAEAEPRGTIRATRKLKAQDQA